MIQVFIRDRFISWWPTNTLFRALKKKKNIFLTILSQLFKVIFHMKNVVYLLTKLRRFR